MMGNVVGVGKNDPAGVTAVDVVVVVAVAPGAFMPLPNACAVAS